MQWISNTWETVKRENFLNWFVSPPRKPSIREISQDRKNAKRAFLFSSRRDFSQHTSSIYIQVSNSYGGLYFYFFYSDILC